MNIYAARFHCEVQWKRDLATIWNLIAIFSAAQNFDWLATLVHGQILLKFGRKNTLSTCNYVELTENRLALKNGRKLTFQCTSASVYHNSGVRNRGSSLFNFDDFATVMPSRHFSYLQQFFSINELLRD